MAKGHIKKVIDKGFGFIVPDSGGNDLFFHMSVVNDLGFEVEEGAPVEYSEGIGRNGKSCATSVKILGRAENIQSSSNRSNTVSNASLPEECIYSSFYDENGNLHKEMFYDSPNIAAQCFQSAQLKSSQYRATYQVYLGIINALNNKSIDFGEAQTRFSNMYVERIVRQHARGSVPQVFKDFFDEHRDLALENPENLDAFFTYIKNIYCYFGDK